MATEFETKYRATPDALRQIAARYPGGCRICMATTYYDTQDSDLSARKWTLRQRQENDRFVCTLKTPAGNGLRRGEWEIPCARIEDAVPILVRESGLTDLTALAAKGLRPVCGARFVRTAVTIAAGDSTAELALDQGELLGGGRSRELWECEIELKSGTEEDILRFSEELANAYRLIPEPKSKFARAMALAQEDEHGI